jgi:hypothetical protein
MPQYLHISVRPAIIEYANEPDNKEVAVYDFVYFLVTYLGVYLHAKHLVLNYHK